MEEIKSYESEDTKVSFHLTKDEKGLRLFQRDYDEEIDYMIKGLDQDQMESLLYFLFQAYMDGERNGKNRAMMFNSRF